MRAVRLRRRGGPEALACEDAPEPRPGPHDVLVRVHAAAVTPTELGWQPTWTAADGTPRPFPIVPGHEYSGVVAAVGAAVHGVAPGDAVYGMNDWYADGAQADYCVAPATALAAKPRTIDHVHAATVPISALTAWQGLERARLGAGERVLVHGGAGGVGLFAVQLAHARGARGVATVSAHNVAFVRDLGADEVVDHRAQRFEDVVHDVDVVFDTVGGDTLARSWGVLRPGGRLVTIAASGEQTAEARVREAFFIVAPSRAQLEEVARLVDAGRLRTVVGAVFPLADARRAYEHRAAHGKVVLDVEVTA